MHLSRGKVSGNDRIDMEILLVASQQSEPIRFTGPRLLDFCMSVDCTLTWMMRWCHRIQRTSLLFGIHHFYRVNEGVLAGLWVIASHPKPLSLLQRSIIPFIHPLQDRNLLVVIILVRMIPSLETHQTAGETQYLGVVLQEQHTYCDH